MRAKAVVAVSVVAVVVVVVALVARVGMSEEQWGWGWRGMPVVWVAAAGLDVTLWGFALTAMLRWDCTWCISA